MTTNETGIILNKLFRLYTGAAKNLNQADRQAMLKTWQEMFKDNSFDEIDKAITAHMQHGKNYMPNPPDIISELNFMNEYEDSLLFIELEKAADMAANPREHIVIDDSGGIYEDPSSPTGYGYKVAETHVTEYYSRDEYESLPDELKRYTGGTVDGLRNLDREIKSSRHFARQRFLDRMPAIRRQIKNAEQ